MITDLLLFLLPFGVAIIKIFWTLPAGLEVFINSFIKDVGLKPFVLPEGLTVPLTPGRVDGLVVGLLLHTDTLLLPCPVCAFGMLWPSTLLFADLAVSPLLLTPCF